MYLQFVQRRERSGPLNHGGSLSSPSVSDSDDQEEKKDEPPHNVFRDELPRKGGSLRAIQSFTIHNFGHELQSNLQLKASELKMRISKSANIIKSK